MRSSAGILATHPAALLGEKVTVDIVLLYIGLPFVDGWRILQGLEHRRLPGVIVISARGEESDKVRALDLGAGTCYLSSLLSSLQFVQSVACLDISRKKMENIVDTSIEKAKGVRSKLELHEADFGEPLPFDSGSFDL